MSFDKKTLKLYGVIGKSDMSEEAYLNKIEQSLKGGVSILQIREKEEKFEDIRKMCLRVKELTDQYQVPLIINDNPAICSAINASGVHLGQRDGSVTEARKLLGENKIIGVSANTVEDAKRAMEESADYIGTGAMFSTSTKLDAERVKIETLKEIVREIQIPVVAIGGINHVNTLELKDTGIAGIAVVSSLYNGEDVFNQAKRLGHAVGEIV